MRRRVRRLRAANPDKVVEVWAEDEARLGLKPITRRDVVAQRVPAEFVRANPIRVALRVRLRPPGHRRDVHHHPPPGPCGADGGGTGRVRRARRPER